MKRLNLEDMESRAVYGADEVYEKRMTNEKRRLKARNNFGLLPATQPLGHTLTRSACCRINAFEP